MNIHVRAAFFAFLGLIPFLSVACADGNDDDLQLSSSASSSSSNSGGTGGSGGMEENIPEPDGPSKLTIVNGVNDYDAIRLCFVPWPDGGEANPYPAETKGIPFAGVSVVDPIAAGIAPNTDIYVHVIVGNLDATAGKSCTDILSGALGTDVISVPIAVIPGSAIAAPRSLLLVPNGCIGGEGHEGNLEKVVCGKEYSISTPTASMIAVGMSRIVDENKVSLQAAHASVGMSTIGVGVQPAGMDSPVGVVAPSLTLGAIGKIPPFREFAKSDFGPLLTTQILTVATGNPMPTSTTPFQSAMERGGIAEADFKDGSAFTLVAVGSPPGVAAGDFWHALTWVVVRSDP